MSRPPRTTGFTLVELLIVFAIVGLLVSLVAPLGMRQMDQARAQEEWMLLDRTLTGLAFSAFTQDSPIRVEAEGRRLSWVSDGRTARFEEFEQLSFDKQVIVFNANGLADAAELRLRQRERPRIMKLNRGFER